MSGFDDFLRNVGYDPKRDAKGKTSDQTIQLGSDDKAQNTRQTEARASVYTGGLGDAATHAGDGNNKKAATSVLTGGVNDANVTMGGKDITDALFGVKNPLSSTPYGVPAVAAPPPINLAPLPTAFRPVTVAAPTTMPATTIAAPGAVVGATINTPTGEGSMTAAQSALVQQLAARAAGQGPSIVDAQAAQARAQNQAAIMSQLASQRGPANPLAARTAMMANVQGNAQNDRDAMMAKVAEQQGAQALLGQVAGQGRNTDVQEATSQATLQQDAALATYKGQLDTAIAQGQIDQRTAETLFVQAQENARLTTQMGQAYNESLLKYIGMGLDRDKAASLAAIDVEKLRQSGALGEAALKVAEKTSNKQLAGGILSGAAGIAGSYFGGKKGGDVASSAVDDLEDDADEEDDSEDEE